MRKTPGWIEGGGGVSRIREGYYSPLPPLLSSADSPLSSSSTTQITTGWAVEGGGGGGEERPGLKYVFVLERRRM